VSNNDKGSARKNRKVIDCNPSHNSFLKKDSRNKDNKLEKIEKLEKLDKIERFEKNDRKDKNSERKISDQDLLEFLCKPKTSSSKHNKLEEEYRRPRMEVSFEKIINLKID